MNEPIKRAVASALDTAISEAASSAFACHTAGLDGNRKEMGLRNAYRNLHRRLANLQMPAYQNPLVPMLYALWYQPFQINLAYAAFRQIAHDRGEALTHRESLQVLDFGCGALAAKFGLWLAALDLTLDGRPVPKIRIELIDSSDGMVDLWEKIWDQFTRMKQYQDLPVLPHLIETRRPTRLAELEIDNSSERWLIALHAFYRSTWDTTKGSLARLYARSTPSLGLMTCHTGNAGIVRNSSPFPTPLRPLEITDLPLSGDLTLVTQRRQGMFQEYNVSDRRGGNRERVQWNPERGLRDNIALICCE